MAVQPDYAFTPPPVNLTDLNWQGGATGDVQDLQQELATLRAQTECLLQELQLCQQTANEQQQLIENLAEQLRQSQQRIQQLEQTQAFQQKRLQEQEAALVEEQQQRQELEARLYRQQQENLRLRQLLSTYAPNADWEKQARLYQDPIPPWSSHPKPAEASPDSPAQSIPTSATQRSKRTAVDLPAFVMRH
ncbi:MAG: hypothetical protein Q6K95_05065 [Gloeomargarita sp. GXS_bins_116]